MGYGSGSMPNAVALLTIEKTDRYGYLSVLVPGSSSMEFVVARNDAFVVRSARPPILWRIAGQRGT
jgi:hypothetical protein